MTSVAFKRLLDDRRIFYWEFTVNGGHVCLGKHATNLQWIVYRQEREDRGEKVHLTSKRAIKEEWAC